MEMTGEFRIPAPRQRVWEGLNDPEILKSSIPGCQTIEKLSDTEFTAKVLAQVGPVKANFARQSDLGGSQPAAELHDRRRRHRRRRRFCEGQRQGEPRRGWRRDGAALCRPGACRRQAGADRLAPDRLGRPPDGRKLLHAVCRRSRARAGAGCTGATANRTVSRIAVASCARRPRSRLNRIPPPHKMRPPLQRRGRKSGFRPRCG